MITSALVSFKSPFLQGKIAESRPINYFLGILLGLGELQLNLCLQQTPLVPWTGISESAYSNTYENGLATWAVC
jgi:hypothetical protein